MFKGQGQTAGLCTNVVHSKPFDSFAWKLSNLIQWMPKEKKCSQLILLLIFQNWYSGCY